VKEAASPRILSPVEGPAAELRAAWRAVANAKLTEFRWQAWRLANCVRQGTVPKADAVDVLWTIATAHALVRAMGDDEVQAIIAEAFILLAQDVAA
jgi:hypothetical protein